MVSAVNTILKDAAVMKSVIIAKKCWKCSKRDEKTVNDVDMSTNTETCSTKLNDDKANSRNLFEEWRGNILKECRPLL